MANDCRPVEGREWAADLATWLIALAILVTLACVVASRRGNLAWDDADYLRRGLANARVSAAGGGLAIVPRTLGCLLHEQPKPPWLVGWIQLGVLVFDRHRLGALIIYATIVPYALLLAAVAFLGRWLQGAWAALAALVCLISSPSSLSYGGKVMVETYLSLWVLLTYALTCRLLACPSRRRGMALGLVVGLAFLTKLTTVLFLPVPLSFALARAAKGGPGRQLFRRSLAWSAVTCAAVAGPWYALNAGKAVRFAQFSSKYNEIAEDRPDRDPHVGRLVVMVKDLAGWPMVATLLLGTLFAGMQAAPRRQRAEGKREGTRSTDIHDLFSRMAGLGAVTAAAILLYPSYFHTRFLLPIWPVVAVELGRRFAVMLPRLHPITRIILGGGLAMGVICAASSLVREPAIRTYWNSATLIDDLVAEYGISNLGNVGNCAEWNVCKTGLINELRDQPASCFVLHDLTKSSSEVAHRRLSRFDAVVVLGEAHLPESKIRLAPGLNRSYGTIAGLLAEDKTFVRVNPPRSEGLPELSVYVRGRVLNEARQSSTQISTRRRL
jgi:hypothetical protein